MDKHRGIRMGTPRKNASQLAILLENCNFKVTCSRILLVLNSQSEEMKSLEYHNIAFATPLFGNLDLKKAILAHSDPRLKNMYHFVNCDDIVPAVAIIEDVYANLTTGVSIWANRTKFLIGKKY